MGGKGQRRREKNYRAAHGGHSRLPPPPNPSSVDALPSKLRQIMAFKNFPQTGSAKAVVDTERRNRRDDGGGSSVNKKHHSEDEFDSKTTKLKGECNGGCSTRQRVGHGDEIVENNSTHEKRKKKRKRKPVNDLRFETAEELGGGGSKRQEHKKKRLEARKRKHKGSEAEENLDFPGCEEIKFGDVVNAPPKLVTIPKALKTTQDASHERLRLQAVEAYRNRKGWASRPGIQLPRPVITLPSL
ncbi:uncharacterized protein LOC132276569 [Cornus florida]|uniref:uncharacterized protein LOC132276569 n=1 Tax=Cornus florida TaxID=4283 RepID=UPI002899A1CD|nr:uncharacterized protein LOC132276569 [Cornus florida]